MKRLLIVSAALALAAILAFIAPWPKPAVEPLAMPSKAAPVEESTALRTNTDASEVFRRAFWREPGADDRILHAERREWVGEENGVRRWQWFLAFHPSAEFLTWLRESNPFPLTKITAEALTASGEAPPWFPAKSKLANHVIHQTPDQSLTLIFAPGETLCYATDAGRGFAPPARRAAPAPASTPAVAGWSPPR